MSNIIITQKKCGIGQETPQASHTASGVAAGAAVKLKVGVLCGDSSRTQLSCTCAEISVHACIIVCTGSSAAHSFIAQPLLGKQGLLIIYFVCLFVLSWMHL